MTERKQSTRHSAAMKLLMPVVATIASAVASYVAKKGPEFLEQTVLPKLRETKDKAASGTGDVADHLTERARAVAGGGSDDREESRSTDELEQRRRERAEHRAARRKAS